MKLLDINLLTGVVLTTVLSLVNSIITGNSRTLATLLIVLGLMISVILVDKDVLNKSTCKEVLVFTVSITFIIYFIIPYVDNDSILLQLLPVAMTLIILTMTLEIVSRFTGHKAKLYSIIASVIFTTIMDTDIVGNIRKPIDLYDITTFGKGLSLINSNGLLYTAIPVIAVVGITVATMQHPHEADRDKFLLEVNDEVYKFMCLYLILVFFKVFGVYIEGIVMYYTPCILLFNSTGNYLICLLVISASKLLSITSRKNKLNLESILHDTNTTYHQEEETDE